MISTVDTAGQVLADVRALQAAEAAAAAALLERVTAWADLHPPESAEWAATMWHRGADLGLPLAGDGAPSVDARCVAELGAALGWSTEAAQSYLGQTLELRHRLPRLWAAVHAGTVPAWAARRVAEQTLPLSRDAADFVDRQVAVAAGRISTTRLNRLIDAAVDQYLPAEAERRRRVAADHRRFDIDHHHGTTGHATVTGVLDLADALDLDAAISDQARVLAELGSTETLDARRSRAAGDLARRQPALDLTTHTSTDAREPAAVACGRGRSCSTCTCPTSPSPERPRSAGSTTPPPPCWPSRSGLGAADPIPRSPSPR